MKSVLRTVMTVLCLLWPSVVMAQNAVPVVSQLEVQSGAEIDRVVLHISQAVPYDSFALDNPARLVVDLPVMDWQAGKGLPAGYKGGVLANIRVARFNDTTTRMVFDLAQAANLEEVSLKNLSDNNSFLLVFDVTTPKYRAGSKQDAPQWRQQAATPMAIRNSTAGVPVVANKSAGDWGALAERAAEPAPMPADLPFKDVPVPEFKPQPERMPMIVIDAGHGGRDPGATGGKGTYEKHVTLAYAKALADALRRTGRYQVSLTRDDDTYIMLRERLAMGRRAKGDIFISVHADSAENSSTRGLSVYTLSENASDAEAAALAARENKVDIIYGMNLSTENKDVTEILIDLAQRETKNKSTKLADIIVEAVGKKVKLLPNTHRYAGFAVLKAPDVPSVLIELGFLSNRKDEALITSSNYRALVVESLVQGIDNYFARQRGK